MSCSTIHQLLVAPKCKTRNARCYHALIPAQRAVIAQCIQFVLQSSCFLLLCCGRLVRPSPSPYHNGHYHTYHECCVQCDLHGPLPAPGAHFPSAEPPQCEDCPCKLCLCYTLHDKDKHKHQVHRGQRTRLQPSQSGLPAKAVCHQCLYDNFGIVFPSQYQMIQHKQSEGQTLSKEKPKKC